MVSSKAPKNEERRRAIKLPFSSRFREDMRLYNPQKESRTISHPGVIVSIMYYTYILESLLRPGMRYIGTHPI